MVNNVGDKSEVNKCLGIRVGLPLVGRASHQINITLKDKLDKEKSIVQKVYSATKKVKYGLLATLLRMLTPFFCLTMDDTCWSLSFCMF